MSIHGMKEDITEQTGNVRCHGEKKHTNQIVSTTNKQG